MARPIGRAAAHEPGDLCSNKHEIEDRQTDHFERYPDVLTVVESNEKIQRAQESRRKAPTEYSAVSTWIRTPGGSRRRPTLRSAAVV